MKKRYTFYLSKKVADRFAPSFAGASREKSEGDATEAAVSTWLERLGPTCTRAELATFCRVTVATVSLWVRKGILPKPLAGSRRWSTLAVVEYLRHGGSEKLAKLSPFEAWARSRGQAA